MSLRRKIERLAGRRSAERELTSRDDQDRRTYDTAWRRFDRRAIAPALMSASLLLPGSVQAAVRSVTTDDGEEPDRETRGRSDLLRGATLYVDPESPARRQAKLLPTDQEGDAALLEYVAAQPVGHWFGDWNADVARDAGRLMHAAARRGGLPLIVAYNIPNRDCDVSFEGGAGSATVYRAWVRDLARGIGDAEAIVVLEPGALGLASCLTHEGRSARFSLIREAVSVLKARTDAVVYIDAGHALWVDPEEMAQRLHLAGMDRADGFALNVANFVSTERNLSYGEQVSRRLGGSRFVIDTSRNGAPVGVGEWCNPAGAALGPAPTTDTGHPLADAFLWIRPPGVSDGTCNGGPEAGEWWTEYALELARGAA